MLAAILWVALAPPQFEVATIRPAAPVAGIRGQILGPTGGPETKDPERYSCRYCALAILLSLSYDVMRPQMVGPNWIDTERFDVTAKVPVGATKEQLRLMLQALI